MPKILFIDDQKADHTLLEKRVGVEIEYMDGETIPVGEWDLVIIDKHLNVLNGYDILRKMGVECDYIITTGSAEHQNIADIDHKIISKSNLAEYVIKWMREFGQSNG